MILGLWTSGRSVRLSHRFLSGRNRGRSGDLALFRRARAASPRCPGIAISTKSQLKAGVRSACWSDSDAVAPALSAAWGTRGARAVRTRRRSGYLCPRVWIYSIW